MIYWAVVKTCENEIHLYQNYIAEGVKKTIQDERDKLHNMLNKNRKIHLQEKIWNIEGLEFRQNKVE